MRGILALADKYQEHTLTHPPDLTTATKEDLDAWVGNIAPPGVQWRIFNPQEQPPLFNK